MEAITANSGPARKVVQDGRTWLVAPLTTIVPGVLAGSKGALYYPSKVVARNAAAWDGMPLTVYHPNDPLTNEHLSAATPGVWERQGVGFLRNTRIDGKTLKHEGWFDAERTRAIDQRVYNALLSGQKMELSTGLFTHDEPHDGTHNGRAYSHVVRGYRPDHLAVLPDQRGACSLDDGCGLNVNTALVANDQARDDKGRWSAGVDEILRHTVGKTMEDFDQKAVDHLHETGASHKVAAMALVKHGKGKWQVPVTNEEPKCPT